MPEIALEQPDPESINFVRTRNAETFYLGPEFVSEQGYSPELESLKIPSDPNSLMVKCRVILAVCPFCIDVNNVHVMLRMLHILCLHIRAYRMYSVYNIQYTPEYSKYTIHKLCMPTQFFCRFVDVQLILMEYFRIGSITTRNLGP